MKGFSTPKIEGKFSLRSSSTGMILMDEVEVPKDNLLPNVSGLSVSSCSSSSVNKNTIFCMLISDRMIRVLLVVWTMRVMGSHGERWELQNSASTLPVSTPWTGPSVSPHYHCCRCHRNWCRPLQFTVSSIRIQFGVPLARNQLMQKKMADMLTEITIGLQSCLTLGRLIEQKK